MKVYKSSKSLKGVAGSFSMNPSPTEQAIFIQMIHQTGYDEARHIGTYSGGTKITVKLSIWEAGNLLDCFSNNREFSTVHKSATGMITVKFSPYFVDNKETGEKQQRGFGIFISKLGDDKKVSETFLLPINFGEKCVIEQYLIVFLRQCFHLEMAEEKKQYKERQSAKIKPAEPNADEELG